MIALARKYRPRRAADGILALATCSTALVTEKSAIRTVLIGAFTDGAFGVRGLETALDGLAHPDGPVLFDVNPSGDSPGGVEPASGGSHQDWRDWIRGPRVLVYGSILGSGQGGFQEEVLGVRYRWGAMFDPPPTALGPDPAADDAIVIAACPTFALQAFHRIGSRSPNGETVLQRIAAPWLPCGPPVSIDRLPWGLRHLVAVVWPSPLHAQFGGGMGGMDGGFSDKAVVNPAGVVIAFDTLPTSGNVDVAQTVVVSAKTALGTSLEHVQITLTVEGNQGTNVVLTGGGPTFTGQNGVATFSISLNKAGGYRIRATASFGGFDDVFIISDLFNIGP